MNRKRTFTLITTLSLSVVVGIFLIPYSISAAESNDPAFWSDGCYITAFPQDRPVCFQSHGECRKAESSDLFKSDDCFKHNHKTISLNLSEPTISHYKE